MNLKRLLWLAVSVVAALTCSAARDVRLSFGSSPANTGFTMSYDDASGVCRYSVFNGNTDHPAVMAFVPLSRDLPSGSHVLRLEYRTTRQVNTSLLYFFSAGNKFKSFQTKHQFTVSSQWQTFEFDFAEACAAEPFFGKTGAFVWIHFGGLKTGDVMEMRNPVILVPDGPYKAVTLRPGIESVIEAEDFDDGNSGYRSVYERVPRSVVYRSPQPDGLAIMAADGPEYPQCTPDAYAVVDGAGFNLVSSSDYDGYTNEALTGGLLDGTLLRMVVATSGLTQDPEATAAYYARSPRLGGWMVADSPSPSAMDGAADLIERIMAVDDEHAFIGTAAEGSKDYLEEYIHRTRIGYVCADVSPGASFADALSRTYARARLYRIPLWATVALTPGLDEVSLRRQVFTALAYGARGVRYTGCCTRYGAGYGLILDESGAKGALYDMVATVNEELGAVGALLSAPKVRWVAHTGKVPAEGLKFIRSMLPGEVQGLDTRGDVCLSVVESGGRLLLMAVNVGDTDAALSAVFAADALRVDAGGGLSPCGKTVDTVLPRGGYLLVVLREGLPVSVDAPVAAVGAVEDADAAYREDVDDAGIRACSEASGGYYLEGMGRRFGHVYGGEYADEALRTVSARQAETYWGAEYRYTFDVAAAATFYVSIGHTVSWSRWGRVAAEGAEPGVDYVMASDPTLNWPREYAASMVLELDGVALVPLAQPLRPVAPSTYDADGAAYNRVLADKSQWKSTANADGSPSEVLYFWPPYGGYEGLATEYHEQPDYRVTLSAGRHVLTVRSLGGPWNFDSILFSTRDLNPSGIDDVTSDDDAIAPVEYYTPQGVRVDTPSHGLYIRRQGSRTDKIVL